MPMRLRDQIKGPKSFSAWFRKRNDIVRFQGICFGLRLQKGGRNESTNFALMAPQADWLALCRGIILKMAPAVAIDFCLGILEEIKAPKGAKRPDRPQQSNPTRPPEPSLLAPEVLENFICSTMDSLLPQSPRRISPLRPARQRPDNLVKSPVPPVLQIHTMDVRKLTRRRLNASCLEIEGMSPPLYPYLQGAFRLNRLA